MEDCSKKTLPIPDFDSGMREALLKVCKFDWSDISPAIFGSLFQSVMDPEERRAKGGHYTTEKKHSEGHRAAVYGRSASGVREVQAPKGHSPPSGPSGVSEETRDKCDFSIRPAAVAISW